MALSIRIPLPEIVSREGLKGHPYPFQISMQTEQFLQARLFYLTITEVARSEYVRLPGNFQKFESTLLDHSFSKDAIAECCDYLERYKDVFQGTVYQSALIDFNSHWDWYSRKLADFVAFARNHVASPTLSGNHKKAFENVGYKSITDQLNIFQAASGVEFNLGENDLGNLKEMSLMRNLGLHNRWEVDREYLRRSASTNLTEGELRIFEKDELLSWHASLIRVLNETANVVAIKYSTAPDYP